MTTKQLFVLLSAKYFYIFFFHVFFQKLLSFSYQAANQTFCRNFFSKNTFHSLALITFDGRLFSGLWHVDGCKVTRKYTTLTSSSKAERIFSVFFWSRVAMSSYLSYDKTSTELRSECSSMFWSFVFLCVGSQHRSRCANIAFEGIRFFCEWNSHWYENACVLLMFSLLSAQHKSIASRENFKFPVKNSWIIEKRSRPHSTTFFSSLRLCIHDSH